MTPTWHTTRNICPHCGGLTEEAEIARRPIAERCPRCKWMLGWAPDWKPRLYGSEPAPNNWQVQPGG